jgi:hypothetical protein
VDYLQEISKVFLTGEEETVIKNLYFDKPALINALEEKELYRTNWNSLLADVRKIRTDISRVRDCEVFGVRHSFNASFQYGEPIKGIIFGVSFPFRIIGFRFAMFEESEHSISTRKRYREILSYVPFDAEMLGLAEDIQNRMVSHFTDFKIFDNRDAANSVGLVLIDCKTCSDIDLWRVLFSTNDYGIF